MKVYTVELNTIQLSHLPFTSYSEAASYARGYGDALANNEIFIEDGTLEIIEYEVTLTPPRPDLTPLRRIPFR